MFQIVNDFEEEARKQEKQGFIDRAEVLRNKLQKTLDLNDWQSDKLKEVSSNFSDKASRLKLEAKNENSKNSQAEKIIKIEKLEREYNQLPITYREKLQERFGDKNFEHFSKSFQEKIISKITYRPDFSSGLLYIGYSTIDYNAANGEIIGYSVTLNDGSDCDLEEGHRCVGTWVGATLSSDVEGILDEDSWESCNADSEVFLYSSGSLPEVRYCVDGDHLYDDSSYCSFQGGGFTTTSEDCLTTPPLPNVTGVTFQTIAPNGMAIDTNPNTGGGLRIFPDDNVPLESVNRQTISVTAVTNANGTATVNFTVTVQPGDNFAIAASTNQNQINSVSVGGTELFNGQGQNISSSCDYTDSVCRSEMLTVWRRLHVEVDSMGAAQQNFVNGNFAETQNVGTSPVAVQVNTSQPLEVNRFENGRLVSGSDSFVIDSNTANSVTIRGQSGGSVTLQNGQIFLLYDDDDFNDNDGAILDGDTGEDIAEPSTSLLTANSDDSNTNIFAPAYVRPVYDIVDNRDNSYFQANVLSDSADDIRPLFVDWDSSNTNTDVEFWSVYVLGAYQHTLPEDNDPSTELFETLGIVDEITGLTGDLEGSGALIFLELHSQKENSPTNPRSTAVTAGHEVGHLFSGDHGEGGIMGDALGQMSSNQFSPATINKIRGLTHP